MSKTIDGKYIFTHKGEDYVPLKNYVKLLNIIEEVKETLINSKEYKMVNAMELNAKQSVLVEVLQILNKLKGE